MLTLLFVLVLGSAKSEPAPYADSIRCAGLAEAALDRQTGDGRRKLFDTAMYWGLAASERARSEGISARRFTYDQKDAKERALRDLAAGTHAGRELDDCTARVPPTAEHGARLPQ